MRKLIVSIFNTNWRILSHVTKKSKMAINKYIRGITAPKIHEGLKQ